MFLSADKFIRFIIKKYIGKINGGLNVRYIDKNEEKIRKAALLHFEKLKNFLKADKKEIQMQVYHDAMLLLTGEEKYAGAQAEFEGYEWLRDFLLADVGKLRQMAAADSEAMKNQYFEKIYETYFSKTDPSPKLQYTAAMLTRSLDLKVCPYCDRNYINNVYRRRDGREIRGSQLDHFFPKSLYPMLSMCFYNLIPVCASCNLRKHKRAFSMNPYEEGIEEQTFFDVKINNDEGYIDEKNIEVHLLTKPGMKENVEILALDEEYKEHSDIAYEILIKATYYNGTKKKEMCRNYPELFGTVSEVNRMLYGMDFEHLHKRPLQKFYIDLLKIYGEWED